MTFQIRNLNSVYPAPLLLSKPMDQRLRSFWSAPRKQDVWPPLALNVRGLWGRDWVDCRILTCHAHALIRFASLICLCISLLSVQCERALGQRIHVISSIRKSLQASPFSTQAALRASGVWICFVADFYSAVEKNERLLADILEGFQAETLRLWVRTGVERQCIVNFASVKKNTICGLLITITKKI